MKICKKCNNQFKTLQKINGIERNLRHRIYCLDCSPFDKHNTKKLHIEYKGITKTCGKCKQEKPINEYYKKSKLSTRHAGYCKSCANSIRLKIHQQNKIKSINYKGGKCENCGYCKCIAALTFHHLDPSEKEFNISRFMGANFEKLKVELDKCKLLCSNCHIEEHYL